MDETISLAIELLKQPSVTPQDAGCQQIMANYLNELGFRTHSINSDKVRNLWAEIGNEGPLFVFAGHTDVVATGNSADWLSPPFSPTIDGEWLRARGAQDMKGALAAMLTACKRLLARKPHLPGRIGFLITSAEEGPDYPEGTPKVIDYLQSMQQKIDWCIVGEPSSQHQLGDMVKIGRRGSFKAYLTIKGKQGHVAYPELAHNPIHAASPFLAEITKREWCKGNSHFPPTTMQISHLASNTKAMNVIPGTLDLWIAFRHSPEIHHETIQNELEALFKKHQLDVQREYELSGKPFITAPGKLIQTVSEIIESQLGNRPTLSTSGGTSDARFIAPTGAEVIELGTCNHSIHQINEQVKVKELVTLSTLYEQIVERLLCGK